MNTITWIPGTNLKLDNLFDKLRETHYQDRTHRLWKNYSKDAFNNVLALTICFNEEDSPELCSSISARDCWPVGAFRILNRLWKVNDFRKGGATRSMSPSFGYTALSQVNWLNKNANCKLYFISRETDNWERWVSKNFRTYNLDFKRSEYKYLTCPNKDDQSCWQNIIYSGDEKILELWNRRIQ